MGIIVLEVFVVAGGGLLRRVVGLGLRHGGLESQGVWKESKEGRQSRHRQLVTPCPSSSYTMSAGTQQDAHRAEAGPGPTPARA